MCAKTNAQVTDIGMHVFCMQEESSGQRMPEYKFQTIFLPEIFL